MIGKKEFQIDANVFLIPKYRSDMFIMLWIVDLIIFIFVNLILVF